MGTRADFYIGKKPKVEDWIGSIAWDGYPDGLPRELLEATTKVGFLLAIQALKTRDDWTKPEQGWPWPWENSHTTDYAYAFDEGKVWVARFGKGWCDASLPEEKIEFPETKNCEFPDMTAIQNVDFGARSGVMILKLGEGEIKA